MSSKQLISAPTPRAHVKKGASVLRSAVATVSLSQQPQSRPALRSGGIPPISQPTPSTSRVALKTPPTVIESLSPGYSSALNSPEKDEASRPTPRQPPRMTLTPSTCGVDEGLTAEGAASKAVVAIYDVRSALESKVAGKGNLKKETREMVMDRLYIIQEAITALDKSRSELCAKLSKACKDVAEERASVAEARGRAHEAERNAADGKSIKEALEITQRENAEIKLKIEEAITEPLERVRRDVEALRNELVPPGEKKEAPATVMGNELRKLMGEIRSLKEQCVLGSAQRVHASSSPLLDTSKMLIAELSGHSGGSVRTYADAARVGHTIIVSSRDPRHTADQVLERIADAVDARQQCLQVEKCRKARDGKVVIGCSDKEGVGIIAEKLRGADLTVTETKMRDPMVEIRDVLAYNKDQDIVDSILKQNKHIIEGLNMKQERVSVRFRRRSRNQLECHVVLEVSPGLWHRLINTGRVYIGFQRRPVVDRSPLVQCVRCLAYGHTRRVCEAQADACGHCGGPHSRNDCESRRKGERPQCCNCTKERRTEGESAHDAFSKACPQSQKWDAIARSRVAYC